MSRFFTVLGGAVIVVTFAVELLVPAGVAIWAPYILAIGLAQESGRRRVLYAAVASSVFLTIIGLPLSPGPVNGAGITNRMFGLSLLVTAGFFAIRHQRMAVELQDSDRCLRVTLNTLADGIITTDHRGVIQALNQSAAAIFGYSKDDLRGRSVVDLMPERYREAYSQRLGRDLKGGSRQDPAGGPCEFSGRRADGTEFPMEVQISQIPLANRLLFVGSVRDTTKRKETELQLSRALKMEAIGQLTGGLAHDFNNLLTIITGNLHALRRRVGAESANVKLIDSAVRAAGRGADLTRRLLAFARRQPLEPRAVDPNAMLREMQTMVRQTLGEEFDVELALSHDAWKVRIDVAQMETVLLNLAINARDAMPAGGRLTLETANAALGERYSSANPYVQPGEYLMIAVSDTGTGIAPEHRERLFEPFFTTKDGKGNGLGLSMTYGFVKQSGGHIKIYSEVGVGTVVKMYLPRFHGEVEPVDAPAPGAMPRGSEKILVVEDNPDVRETVSTLLTDLGYKVLTARDGADALDKFSKRPDIALVFTDVVMPGAFGGLELAERLRELREDLRVLYTSGYTPGGIVHKGELRRDAALLSKPYSDEELARKVREVLDVGA